jgi:hypothetical protein
MKSEVVIVGGGPSGAAAESEDEYSIPIGSGYHPERAPIWESDSDVESTEEWMGPR